MERLRIKKEFPQDDAKSVSRTKQSFKKKSNINNIIAKYNRTGILATTPGVTPTRAPVFGDFTNAGTYMDQMIKITKFNEEFMALPSTLRNKFQNNPALLIDFLANPDNAVEAMELGLKQIPDGHVLKDGKLVAIPTDPVKNEDGTVATTEPTPEPTA